VREKRKSKNEEAATERTKMDHGARAMATDVPLPRVRA
jgi:hypothetical protein